MSFHTSLIKRLKVPKAYELVDQCETWAAIKAQNMFYDLCLQGDEPDAFLQRDRAAMAVRLGYDCVATSHTAADRLVDKDRCSHLLNLYCSIKMGHLNSSKS